MSEPMATSDLIMRLREAARQIAVTDDDVVQALLRTAAERLQHMADVVDRIDAALDTK